MSFIPNLTYSIASTVWSGTSAALGKGHPKSAATTTTVTGPSTSHNHHRSHHHHHHHHPHHHSSSSSSTNGSTNGGPGGPGGPTINSGPGGRRYSHGRRYSNTNYNFSRSYSYSSGSSPVTPPHSPSHSGSIHSGGSGGYGGSNVAPERRSHRKRNPSISSMPRTPPSSPQLDNASPFDGHSSHHSSYTGPNFSRKRNNGEYSNPSSSSSSRPHSYHSGANANGNSNGGNSRGDGSHRSSGYSHGHGHGRAGSSSADAKKSSRDKETPPAKAAPTAEERYKIVDDILETQNLYRVLAVNRNATAEEIRRAYIAKSRVCHPDKFPEYPRATEAFQKLSLAYETLSKPSSRFVYDSTGGASGKNMLAGDETLQSVLSQVFFEFMEGDFEVIRNMINTMNNTSGGVRLGEDVIGVIEEMFLRLRFILLGCKKYMTLVHDQVQQLSEIHHSMRSLAYLDVLGRFRLTLKLSKVMLTIPMIIQDEMRREIAVAAALEGGSDQDEANAKKNKGIVGTVFLNDRVETVLKTVVSAIETGERWV